MNIERLQQQKQNSDSGDFDIGVKNGADWAEDAHYKHIVAVVNSPTIPDSVKGDDVFDPENHGYFEEMYKSLKEWNMNVEQWEKGWVEGVKMFWNDVKEYLE